MVSWCVLFLIAPKIVCLSTLWMLFLSQCKSSDLGHLCPGKCHFFTENNATPENQADFPSLSSAFPYVYCLLISVNYYGFNIFKVFQSIDFYVRCVCLPALLLTMQCYLHISYVNMYICRQWHFYFYLFTFLYAFFLNSIFVTKIWKIIRRDKECDNENSKKSFF